MVVVIALNDFTILLKAISGNIPVALGDLILGASESSDVSTSHPSDVAKWASDSAPEVIALHSRSKPDRSRQVVLMTLHRFHEALTLPARCEMEAFAPSVFVEVLRVRVELLFI